MKKLVLDLLSQSYLNAKILASFKRKFAKKTGLFPKNSLLLAQYWQMVKMGEIKPKASFEKALRLKKVRSLSGIIPVAVLTKPYPCPGRCVYCPTQVNMPKSYLDDEPAVMRAKQASFNPSLQMKRRLRQLKETGHSLEKIELIVMGGTFTALPHSYQKSFIKKCFEAANGEKSKTLAEAQKTNQTAKNRIIGLTLETRPDEINISEIKRMRILGCTRVEIGVQTIYDSILKKVNRGHLTKATIKATKLLKDAGIKVCYHLMPNLPGSRLSLDFKMFKEIFSNEKYMPDMIKIYPCVVCYQAKLYQWFKKGKYKPYKDEELIKLLLKIKKIVPAWVRINRLGRDIPVNNIAAGNKLSNIRQVLEKRKDFQCQCIRCREIKEKGSLNSKRVKFNQIKYSSSGGEEYFLEYTDKENHLFALLRLRIPSQIFSKKNHFIPELENSSIIRELHTYGESLPLGKKGQASQHLGLGKKLLKKAEEITKNLGIKKIAVISGIGVREYYQKMWYKLQNTYMIKNLNLKNLTKK